MPGLFVRSCPVQQQHALHQQHTLRAPWRLQRPPDRPGQLLQLRPPCAAAASAAEPQAPDPDTCPPRMRPIPCRRRQAHRSSPHTCMVRPLQRRGHLCRAVRAGHASNGHQCETSAGSSTEPTLGAPVVPEVYMMVHRSAGCAGTGSTGRPAPMRLNSSKDCTVTPWLPRACGTGSVTQAAGNGALRA